MDCACESSRVLHAPAPAMDRSADSTRGCEMDGPVARPAFTGPDSRCFPRGWVFRGDVGDVHLGCDLENHTTGRAVEMRSPLGVLVLRHTFCSHLAMKGAPARAIQELAGHADLWTTESN